MYVKLNVMTVKGTLVSPTMCKFTYIMCNFVMYVRLYITAFLMKGEVYQRPPHDPISRRRALRSSSAGGSAAGSENGSDVIAGSQRRLGTSRMERPTRRATPRGLHRWRPSLAAIAWLMSFASLGNHRSRPWKDGWPPGLLTDIRYQHGWRMGGNIFLFVLWYS